MSFEEIFDRIRREIRRIWREIEEELENELLGPMWDTSGRLEPLISMDRRPDRYTILIDLPYADLNSLSIEIKGRRVKIECKLASRIRFERWSAFRETTFDRYYTEFMLPEDAEASRAVIEKDVVRKILKIIVPRRY